MHAKHAGIHFGKKILAQKKNNSNRQDAKAQKAANYHLPVFQTQFQRLRVAVAQPFKAGLEALADAAKEASLLLAVLVPMVVRPVVMNPVVMNPVVMNPVVMNIVAHRYI